MPKIAIDISPLNDGNKLRGVGYYTKNLVEALQNEVKINPEYQEYKISLISNKSELSDDFDLIHYPYFNPFKLTLPFIKKKPTIISIHDVIERQFKKHFPVGIKGEIKWRIQKFLARQADYIITISHYSKFTISTTLKYPVDQIYVTYLAASANFHKINNQKKLAEITKKYHLPPKFILYVGDINWNKNIANLCKACIKLNYPLVISGKQAQDIDKLTLQPPSITRPLDLLRHLFKHQSPQLTHVSELKILFSHPLIHRLGFVSDEKLPFIYNLATIYCQPSFAEGFGIPAVEAMQCGTPVVYSQETSLTEVLDYNGLMFNPYDQSSLEAALNQFWTNRKLRQKYSFLGLKRSQIFNWKYTAIQTLAVYQLALINDQK